MSQPEDRNSMAPHVDPASTARGVAPAVPIG